MEEVNTKIRFCLNCRHELPDNAQFCPKCGCKRGEDDNEAEGTKKIYCPVCGLEVLPDINGPFCYNCQKLVGTMELIDKNVRQSRKVKIVRDQPSGASDPMSNYGIATDGIPLAVKRASFPIAMFFPIWLIAHKMGIWIVAMLVAMPIVSMLLIMFIPIIGWIVAIFGNLWVYIHLVRHGNELAWRRGQYRNLDDFFARERKWRDAAWFMIAIAVLLGIVLGVVLVWSASMHEAQAKYGGML